MTQEEIKTQAEYLAKENREAEPTITKVYWFPDPDGRQVRLVELTPVVPAGSHHVNPVYFRASPQYQLPAPSGIAMIRPDEYGQLALPSGWGAWEDGVEL